MLIGRRQPDGHLDDELDQAHREKSVGACVSANKLPGIRAGLCHDCYSARQGVEHDDMNVLVLGSRVVGPALATDLLDSYVAARFHPEERHRRRLDKIRQLEARFGELWSRLGGGAIR